MQKQDGLSNMERSSEKNSDLRSRVNCEGAETGVKGRDERQRTAPLTPLSTPKRFFALFPRKTGKKEYLQRRRSHTWVLHNLRPNCLRYCNAATLPMFINH